MSVKPYLLLVVTRSPGTCGTCRHANHGTVDIAEQHIFCKWGGPPIQAEHVCDKGIVACRTKNGPPEEGYYFYEIYDGTNCTWGFHADYRILADDADESMRAEMEADKPLIPADADPNQS